MGAIPAGGPGGAATLLSLRTTVRQEADIENDPHISDAELTGWINASRFELYDILVTRFGEDYYSSQAVITTDGVNAQFPLPDGALYGGAPPFYKGALVEAIAGGNVSSNLPVTLRPFNLREKNRYNLPQYAYAIGFMYPRYRIVGSNLMFAPLPAAGLQVQLWYAPRQTMLVNDVDVAEDYSGWLEYVVVDAAIKALMKQERDASGLAARKSALLERVAIAATNRNVGDPDSVIDTSTDGVFAPNGMWMGRGW